MSDVPTAEEVQQAISAALAAPIAPLKEQLRIVDQALTVARAEVARLTAMQTELRRVLRSLDPTFTKGSYNAKASKAKTNGGTNFRASRENVDRVADWFREHADEIDAAGGVSVRQIVEHASPPGLSKSPLGYAIRSLHDEGLLRIDHVVKGPGSPQKFWRLADHAAVRSGSA